MLIEFRVENHRSLRNELVMTMAVGRGGDDSDPRPRHVPGHDEDLLTVAAIYGANASGKSNVLTALNFVREAVMHSHRFWAPDEGVPRTSFAWGAKHAEPSLFEVKFLVAGVRYEYGFVASDECFVEEWLYAWPNGRQQSWFEREEGKPIKFGENLKGENKVIEEVTRPNALFLSAAAQHRHAQLQPITSWFRSVRPMNLGMSSAMNRRFYAPSFESENSLTRLFDSELGESNTRQPMLFADEQGGSIRERFRNLIRKADIGIVDVKVVAREFDDQPRPRRIRRFLMQHQSDTEDAWLPLEEESRGTQTLFRMALPILQVMDEGWRRCRSRSWICVSTRATP